MELSAAVVLLCVVAAVLGATHGAVHTLADGGGNLAQPIGVNVSSERMETVKPVVTYRSENTSCPREVWIAVRTRKNNYGLRLKRNHGMIMSGFSSTHFDQNERKIVQKGYPNCIYCGDVEGHPEWRVTLNLYNGIQGSFGDVTNRHHYYHLEPVGWGTDIERMHAIFADSDIQHPTGTCAHRQDGEESVFNQAHVFEGPKSGERLRRLVNGYSVIELVIVSDFQHYQQRGSSVGNVVNRALSITNTLDEVFRNLSVRVVLVGVVVWSSGDQITVVSNPLNLLYSFRDYKPRITTPHDSALLLTGEDLDGASVGVAFIDSMCDQRSSVSLVQDRGGLASTIAAYAAHEVGHLFGMGHDTGSCQCSDTTGMCIMAAVLLNPVPNSWSRCSESSLQRGFSSLNLGRCLTNEPTITIGDPVCGNGIREGDEVCDCGSVQECQDPCCDAAQCRLRENAQCHSGPCCKNCQFVSYGTTCREAAAECDITEYCSGESHNCPVDATLQDGSLCLSSQSFCFSGQCRSYNEQCQRYFATNKGTNDCYLRYNVIGNAFGNCGHNLTHYLPCTVSNALCGQLHCEKGELQLTSEQIGARLTIGTYSAFNEDNNIVQCTSFTPDPGEFQNPGLVQDGTKCGTNKLCFGQRCLSLSELNIAQCPMGNGQVCSGNSNGVCNSFGLCSCRVGFTGSACEHPITSVPSTSTHSTAPSTSTHSTAHSTTSSSPRISPSSIFDDVTSNKPTPITTSNGPSFTMYLDPSLTDTDTTSTPLATTSVGDGDEPSVVDASSNADSVAAPAIGGAVGGVVAVVIISVCVVIVALVLIRRRKKKSYQSKEKVPVSKITPQESQSKLLSHTDTGLSTADILSPSKAPHNALVLRFPPPLQANSQKHDNDKFVSGAVLLDGKPSRVRQPPPPPRPSAHSSAATPPAHSPPPHSPPLTRASGGKPKPPARPAMPTQVGGKPWPPDRAAVSLSQPQPTLSQTHPALSHPQLALSRPQPILSRPQPTLSQPQPALSRPQPTLSQPQPALSRPQPTLSQPQPALSRPQPALSRPQPALSQPQPKTARTKPRPPPPPPTRPAIAASTGAGPGSDSSLMTHTDSSYSGGKKPLIPPRPKPQ